MPTREREFRSLQINRSVEVTPDLERFLARANFIGLTVFTPRHSILAEVDVDDLGDIPGELEELPVDGEVLTRTIGLARHTIYDKESLKVHLLDRRVPQADAKPFWRLYQRLLDGPGQEQGNRRQGKVSETPDWRSQIRQSGLRHDIPDTSSLSVWFDSIDIASNPGYNNKGYELSLLPQMSPQHLQLIDEMDICFAALRDINTKAVFPVSKESPLLSFMRLPNDASDGQVDDMVNRLKRFLPVRLELGEPTPNF